MSESNFEIATDTRRSRWTTTYEGIAVKNLASHNIGHIPVLYTRTHESERTAEDSPNKEVCNPSDFSVRRDFDRAAGSELLHDLVPRCNQGFLGFVGKHDFLLFEVDLDPDPSRVHCRTYFLELSDSQNYTLAVQDEAHMQNVA